VVVGREVELEVEVVAISPVGRASLQEDERRLERVFVGLGRCGEKLLEPARAPSTEPWLEAW
jgi:hypothetical protein